jgi:hypothetical protein
MSKAKQAQINALAANAEKVYFSLSLKAPMAEFEVTRELESKGIHIPGRTLRKLLMELVESGVVKQSSIRRNGKFVAVFVRNDVRRPSSKKPKPPQKTEEEKPMQRGATERAAKKEVTVDSLIEAATQALDASKASLDKVTDCMVELSVALDNERAKIADMEQLRDVLSRLT